MSNINVIDIETYGNEVLTPYCIVVKYKNTYYTCVGYNCVSAILKLLFTKCFSESVFYAHNLTFDGILLLNYLPKDTHLNSKNTIIRKGSIYSMCLTYNNKYLIFKCSAKLLPLSLKKIAEELDLPLKLDFNHKAVTSDSINDSYFLKESLEYCKRDVEITFKFLRKLDYSVSCFLPY
jgi:predicted transport protein